MLESVILSNLLQVFLFPFAQIMVFFAWGVADDPVWLMGLKRVFILMPIIAMIGSYWASIACLLSIPFRSGRQRFITSLFLTWWEFGRSVLLFWGGTFKLIFVFFVSLSLFLKLTLIGLWIFIQDIALIPFRVAGNISKKFLNPGVPWIAISMTIFWCLFEALIFTYVTTPLAMDTLSNMTGRPLTEVAIRIPLYLFMLFIILGSYAILSTWNENLKSKNIPGIIKIGAIEFVALSVEVVFLYREFVDALVPWFQSHSSGKFELGIIGTLSIASGVWFGVRSLSWFLFAASGTPTIMAIIQGTGVQLRENRSGGVFSNTFGITIGTISQIKKEMDSAREQGEIILDAFLLPPLQVIAACINFFGLLISSQPLFHLPFKNVKDLRDPRGIGIKAGDRIPGVDF